MKRHHTLGAWPLLRHHNLVTSAWPSNRGSPKTEPEYMPGEDRRPRIHREQRDDHNAACGRLFQNLANWVERLHLLY